jgi:hypothetical protein
MEHVLSNIVGLFLETLIQLGVPNLSVLSREGLQGTGEETKAGGGDTRLAAGAGTGERGHLLAERVEAFRRRGGLHGKTLFNIGQQRGGGGGIVWEDKTFFVGKQEQWDARFRQQR